MTKQPESHTALYDACQEILRLEQVNAELLEALSELSEFCKELGFSWSCLLQAQAAIAKAEVKHD